MPIALQTGVVYGPLKSRRFGNSLGINLLPADQKVCSFDCGYCQYGKTKMKAPFAFPAPDQIESEVDSFFLKALDEKIPLDWMMIAGNGEPTLHPRFKEVVEALIYLRDRAIPALPIGILSNASTCDRPEIQEALLKLDKCFMKLDAGSLELFEAINQPFSKNQWRRIMQGLYHLRRLTLQSMFVEGRVDNTTDQSVDEWIRAVHYVRPESVLIYTLDRPTAEEGILAVSKEKLDQIAGRLLKETGIECSVYD
jgi:wyosine [tRNA(Phe)-imidazoG37] synthetase (radical SAM superfamily)